MYLVQCISTDAQYPMDEENEKLPGNIVSLDFTTLQQQVESHQLAAHETTQHEKASCVANASLYPESHLCLSTIIDVLNTSIIHVWCVNFDHRA